GAARRGAGFDLALEDVAGDAAELDGAARLPFELAHRPADAGVGVGAARGQVRLEIAVQDVAGQQIDRAAVDGDVGGARLDVDLGGGERAGELAGPVRLDVREQHLVLDRVGVDLDVGGLEAER